MKCMKKLLPFVLAVVLSTGIVGCSNNAKEVDTEALKLQRFERIEIVYTGEIVYDTETGVEYFYTGRGGMTMLVKADGTPLIYGEDER